MSEIEDAKRKEQEEKTKVKYPYEEDKDKKKKSDSDPLYSESMKLSIKIMERMVNQNAENEVYHDFKYWEDRSDEFRDGDGTLLPLWRFSSEKAKRKQVTSIKWNPRYNDLCAVGFGSYDFMRQGTGVICCYSLKNTRYPEYVFNTDAGVCSLDWHPLHPALLAVGLYDGTVLVYDVRAKTKKPIYASTVRTNKHTDPVWEVRWNNDESSGTLNFYSISSDGRVSNWFMMKNKLESEEVMELKLISNTASNEDDETSLTGLAGGLCFDFNKQNDHLFLIGTEEGRIHKCSKAFSGQYLETYDGHTMAVYTVRWNPYHPKIFISASADWTVKMWDHTNRTPVMSFDLAQAIGDVAWAPFSSTVFAAITSDGIVHVYDLHVNRNERVCYQKVVKRAKLTHVAFNNIEPIIIVGDDRGGVNTLKLSPNLRKGIAAMRTEETPADVTDEDLQNKQMDHLLEMVTETKEV
jgi:dynein intermediate chain 1